MLRRVGAFFDGDPAVIEFDNNVHESDVCSLAGDPNVRVLQCCSPVQDSVWRLLDTCFFAERPDVQLRIYGHYSGECDLRVAQYVPNVRHFAADCLITAQNVECIAEIPGLESLSLGIFELADFRVLERLPPTLHTLVLGATRSKKPSLAPLSRFRELKLAYLEGHSRDIEVLAGLNSLEDVTLRSITTDNLTYLAPLERLWSLDIKLGGIRSFEGIEQKASIRYLELWQVHGLADVGMVAELPGLQNLFLQSLPRVKSLPSLAHAMALRRVSLQNLKGLGEFGPLEEAPALEEFLLNDGARQEPEQLIPVLRNPHVRRVSAFFGSQRKNEAFSLLREQHGKLPMEPWYEFEYR